MSKIYLPTDNVPSIEVEVKVLDVTLADLNSRFRRMQRKYGITAEPVFDTDIITISFDYEDRRLKENGWRQRIREITGKYDVETLHEMKQRSKHGPQTPSERRQNGVKVSKEVLLGAWKGAQGINLERQLRDQGQEPIKKPEIKHRIRHQIGTLGYVDHDTINIYARTQGMGFGEIHGVIKGSQPLVLPSFLEIEASVDLYDSNNLLRTQDDIKADGREKIHAIAKMLGFEPIYLHEWSGTQLEEHYEWLIKPKKNK